MDNMEQVFPLKEAQSQKFTHLRRGLQTQG